MNIKRFQNQLLQDEGLKLKLYKCPANKLTIGVGRNIEERGISKDEAYLMLSNDIRIVEDELKTQLLDKHGIKLNLLSDVRIEVLMNMAFQMGVPRLMKFKKTFKYLSYAIKTSNTLVATNYYFDVSKEMLDSFWFRQMHEYDMQDGTDSVNRAERLAYAMKHDKFMKGV